MEELQRTTGVTLHVRGGEVTIDGEDAAAAMVERLLRQMVGMARGGTPIHSGDLSRALEVMRREPRIDLRSLFDDTIVGKTGNGRPIAPRSLAQKYYVDCLRRYDLNFGVGPAGTGKTYLAVAMGVRMLMDKRVRRIILTRPAIEAGENLGFLPGTFEEKISPYMRPLYDALHDMLDVQKVLRMMEQGVIEIAPLAYMRGRTLSETFLILDEAQNTTPEQMKMFLTRIGFGARAVVNGDVIMAIIARHMKAQGALKRNLVVATVVGTTIVGIGTGIAYAAMPSMILLGARKSELAAANDTDRGAWWDHSGLSATPSVWR